MNIGEESILFSQRGAFNMSFCQAPSQLIARFLVVDALPNLRYRNTVLTICKTLVHRSLGSKQPPLDPRNLSKLKLLDALSFIILAPIQPSRRKFLLAATHGLRLGSHPCLLRHRPCRQDKKALNLRYPGWPSSLLDSPFLGN